MSWKWRLSVNNLSLFFRLSYWMPWIQYVKKRKSILFGTTWRWVNDDRNYIFWWTFPFCKLCWLSFYHVSGISKNIWQNPQWLIVKNWIFAYRSDHFMFFLWLSYLTVSPPPPPISLVCVHRNVPGARQPWVYRFSWRTPQESNAGL